MGYNPNKAFLTGTNKVLEYYDSNAKTPYWSVTDAKNVIIFQHTDDDMHESRQKLEDNLLAAEAAGMTATLTLRFHPKKPKDGYFDNKAPVMQATYFRPCEFEMQPYNNNNNIAGNAMLAQQLAAIESRLNAMQMKMEAEEDEEEEEEEEDGMGFLSGLMGNPAIKQMFMNVVANLVTPNKQANVTQVAGIDQPETETEEEYTEQDAKIDEAIERLKVHDPILGDDLLKLCQIAESDPNQFKMLLKMLRM